MTSSSHAGSTPATLGRRWMWAWPFAALLGFPIGGLVANVTVGAVDSVGAALAGGLIAGAIVGTAQWLALKQFVAWHWIVATPPSVWAPAWRSAPQLSTTGSIAPNSC